MENISHCVQGATTAFTLRKIRTDSVSFKEKNAPDSGEKLNADSDQKECFYQPAMAGRGAGVGVAPFSKDTLRDRTRGRGDGLGLGIGFDALLNKVTR